MRIGDTGSHQRVDGSINERAGVVSRVVLARSEGGNSDAACLEDSDTPV